MIERTKDLMIAWCSGTLFITGIMLIYGFFNEGWGLNYLVPGIIFFIFSIYCLYSVLK